MTRSDKPAKSQGHALSLTASEIRRIVGDITDAKVMAILATDPSLEDLEEAVAWVEGETDVLGDLNLPMTGKVGEIYEILTAGEEWEEEPRREG